MSGIVGRLTISLISIIALVGALAIHAAAAEEAREPGWMDSDRPNCQIWNGNPQIDETVTWTGDCMNGKAQGHGKQVWLSRDKQGSQQRELFKGTLREGRPEGQGIATYSDGGSYDGQWKGGKYDGYGVRIYAAGDRYEGYWKSGVRSGQGLTVYQNGDSFRGPFETGKAHGTGECIEKEGRAGKCLFVEGTFSHWVE